MAYRHHACQIFDGASAGRIEFLAWDGLVISMRKILLISLAIVIAACAALGGLAWLGRERLVLAFARHNALAQKVAPNHPVEWAAGPQQLPADAPARPPNIIFILADDLGINDITAYGGGLAEGRVPTPHIDALARSGASFRQAYSGTSSCAPSRAMIMTGRYPTRTGFEFTPTPDGMGRAVTMIANSNGRKTGDGTIPSPKAIYHRDVADRLPPFALQGLPGSEVTIAEVLRTAGYHNVHIGKWHTGLGPEFGPNAQGFDEALIMASGLHLRADDPNAVNAKLDFDPIDKFLWAVFQHAASFNEGPWFEPKGYLADYYTDEAIKVIHANRNRPFFLNLAHWGVHSPLQATRADYEAVGDIQPHRLRVYAAMVRALDRSVGRILEALKAEGLDQNTLIVFSSDNGAPGYVGLSGVNAPYRGWKLTLFEGGIRVPLMLSWPGRIAPGQDISAPVAHIDLMPTLAAAGKAALPANVAIDGVNLLPIMLDPAHATRPHETLFWQSGPYRVVRHGDWKLQITTRPKRAWLFDLAQDPTEQHDLAASNPAKLAQLQALLDAHGAGARTPLYPFTVEAPIAIDKTLDQPLQPGDEFVYWPN